VQYPSGFFKAIRNRLACLSIFSKIAIGNAIIITVSGVAIAATILALTKRTSNIFLIFLVAILLSVITIVVSCLMISRALLPLTELRAMIDQVREAHIGIDLHRVQDPDLGHLVLTINSLVSQLSETNQRMRAISNHALDAQEDERKRIARTLHDDTGQALSSLIFNLERIEQQLPPELAGERAKLQASRLLANETLQNLRKIVYGLRPAILDDLGLVPAIRWYARANLEPAAIHFNLHAPSDLQPLPPRLATTLFRIAQEAINNIVRHSKAQTATITLVTNPGEINLQIEDDGQGFSVHTTSQDALQQRHWGLLGIEERVALVGGDVHIASEPGKGTLIQVSVPLPGPGELTDEEDSHFAR